MPNIVELGYAEMGYGEQPYGAGFIGHGIRCEVDRITDNNHVVRSEIDRQIATIHNIRSEVDRLVTGNLHHILSEVEGLLTKGHAVHSEIDRRIQGTLHTIHAEIIRGKNPHLICNGYAEGGYAEDPYAVAGYCVTIRTEIERLIAGFPHVIHSEIERKIVDKLHRVKAEVERKINAIHAIHAQVLRLQSHAIHCQIQRVLYNTKLLRILSDFPSRGLTGVNWTANSTEPGDFGVNNLNTDIVEQIWRTATSVKTGVILTCDTEVTQGVFIDTFAILNHNLTRNVDMVLLGSNDATFSTVGVTIDMDSTQTYMDYTNNRDIFYIAPTLPGSGYRYWRLLISDGTNSADFLQIGTLVFGSSIIFNGECFVDRVTRPTKHFADRIPTEGFTNVSNDRALKYGVSLDFKSILYTGSNYPNIREVFDTARTSFKCLWIPTPQYPGRFAVFGKLSTVPTEVHNSKGPKFDYVDFNIDVDESL